MVEEEELVEAFCRTDRVESDLKEGEGDEEAEGKTAMGKEEDTSLPSFSWRQKAQIPPWVWLLYGWSKHCIVPSPMSSITASITIFESHQEVKTGENQ